MTTSDADVAALDEAIETALINEDFIELRKTLLKLGYSIPEDEHESNLFKALQLDEKTDPDRAAALLFLEENIRKREVQTLRLILVMNGHQIGKPDFVRQYLDKDNSVAYESAPHFSF